MDREILLQLRKPLLFCFSIKIETTLFWNSFYILFVSDEELLHHESLLINLCYSHSIKTIIFKQNVDMSQFFNGFIMLVNVQDSTRVFKISCVIIFNLCLMSDMISVTNGYLEFHVVVFLFPANLTYLSLIISIHDIRISATAS